MILSKIPAPILSAAVKFATFGNKTNVATLRFERNSCGSYTHIFCYRKNSEFIGSYPGNSFIGNSDKTSVVVSIYGTPPASGLGTISTIGKSIIFENTNSKTKALHAIIQKDSSKKHKEWLQAQSDYIRRFDKIFKPDEMQPGPVFFDYRFVNSIVKGLQMITTKRNEDHSVKFIDVKSHFETKKGENIGGVSLQVLAESEKYHG